MKIRCPGCGKKSTDPMAERCRICATMLPGSQRRLQDQQNAADQGPSFSALVESEVGVWREYEDGGGRRGPKSRRPVELGGPGIVGTDAAHAPTEPTAPPVRHAPPAPERSSTEQLDDAIDAIGPFGRSSHATLMLRGFAVGAAVLLGSWLAFLR
ncbi:MAG TPA: hypothetical protein VGZ52_07275 [Acidimicrobiales bacterium]|nr:hypothetical protein [Acidimicrobiales bacterium]